MFGDSNAYLAVRLECGSVDVKRPAPVGGDKDGVLRQAVGRVDDAAPQTKLQDIPITQPSLKHLLRI